MCENIFFFSLLCTLVSNNFFFFFCRLYSLLLSYIRIQLCGAFNTLFLCQHWLVTVNHRYKISYVNPMPTVLSSDMILPHFVLTIFLQLLFRSKVLMFQLNGELFSSVRWILSSLLQFSILKKEEFF